MGCCESAAFGANDMKPSKTKRAAHHDEDGCLKVMEQEVDRSRLSQIQEILTTDSSPSAQFFFKM